MTVNLTERAQPTCTREATLSERHHWVTLVKAVAEWEMPDGCSPALRRANEQFHKLEDEWGDDAWRGDEWRKAMNEFQPEAPTDAAECHRDFAILDEELRQLLYDNVDGWPGIDEVPDVWAAIDVLPWHRLPELSRAIRDGQERNGGWSKLASFLEQMRLPSGKYTKADTYCGRCGSWWRCSHRRS